MALFIGPTLVHGLEPTAKNNCINHKTLILIGEKVTCELYWQTGGNSSHLGLSIVSNITEHNLRDKMLEIGSRRLQAATLIVLAMHISDWWSTCRILFQPALN